MKYKVTLCTLTVDATTPQGALWKVIEEVKNGRVFTDEVIDEDGIIRISYDNKRIGEKWSEK